MSVESVGDWRLFLAVAGQGSFSGAARRFGLTVAQVSKRVARLEASLGVRLFHRTTRVVRLTDEGTSLRPQVQALVDDWDAAATTFQSRQVTGTLRITSVPFLAHRLLTPVLREFLKRHPGLRVELELTERLLNLAENQIDLALRIHSPREGTLVYRPLAPNHLVLCASPRYLRRASPLKRPADLHQHSILCLSLHGRVALGGGGERLGDFFSARRWVCEEGGYLTQLALEGEGVLVRSRWDVEEHLRKGRLVEVLPKHPLEPFGQIHAVVPTRKWLAPRVRLFLDALVEQSASWGRLEA